MSQSKKETSLQNTGLSSKPCFSRALRFLFSITSLFLFASCSSTQTIQQSRDLSTSGLAYTKAVEALTDVTIDRIIEFDSSVAIKSRRGASEEQLKKRLSEQNSLLITMVASLHEFKGQNKLLRAYFQNLQALSDSPIKEELGGAVTELSGSINQLNQSLMTSYEISDEQQANIGGLVGLVGQSMQAEKLKNTFVRDAAIISTQLVLQEKQLEIISDILKDRFNAENDLFYRTKVEAPYANIDGHPLLGDKWSADREQYIRSEFTQAQLETAIIAAKQLRGIWSDILQGGNDLGSLKLLISDVDEFVIVIKNIEQSIDVN